MAFINNSKKFIFIGNARCASTSMYLEVENLSNGDDNIWPKGLLAKPKFYHMGIGEVLKEYPQCESYFKFAFTRNPWCRFVSAWHEFQNPGHRHWNEEIYKYDTFTDFCLDFENCSLSKDIHFYSIYDQVTIDGEVSVDFIGRFESLSQDFQRATERINTKRNLSIHRRPTKAGPYRDFYNDTTRDLIGKFYQKDIELFGYEF